MVNSFQPPLFWTPPDNLKKVLVLQDTVTYLFYSLSASNAQFLITPLGTQGTLTPKFTLVDKITGEYFRLVITDGVPLIVSVVDAVNVVPYTVISDLVTGEQFQIAVANAESSISDAPVLDQYGLGQLIPLIYTLEDSDGSLQTFLNVYDASHTLQLVIIRSLATIRIPTEAPLRFIPTIADSLGSPFTFMSPYRWQKGNKLCSLPYIYAHRGSLQGVLDTIRYLTGVSASIKTDTDYSWVLGVSNFP